MEQNHLLTWKRVSFKKKKVEKEVQTLPFSGFVVDEIKELKLK